MRGYTANALDRCRGRTSLTRPFPQIGIHHRLSVDLSQASSRYLDPLTIHTDKVNFAPSKADQIDALHERVASRLKWVIDTNQGLYLKLGQALGEPFPVPSVPWLTECLTGLQAALLPKPYREAFANVFDKAPSVSYDEVVGVRLCLNPSSHKLVDKTSRYSGKTSAWRPRTSSPRSHPNPSPPPRSRRYTKRPLRAAWKGWKRGK